MTVVGTTRLYRPAPDSIDEPEICGRATFSVSHPKTARIQVDVCGEVDAVNGRALGRYVERHTGTSKQLILDLRFADFFGTQGFTALYYISVHCNRSDVDWAIVTSRAVQRVLQICDPDGELPVAADIEGAVERLDRAAQSRQRISPRN
jgi:anti-anti-sigma factor